MTHDEQRVFLIRELLAEEPEYKNIHIPEDKKGQEDLLRSLMNVRMPKPVSENFLKVQHEYLQKERDMRGVVDSEKLAPAGADERIAVWQGDITTLKVDAIVNAANSALRGCFHPLHSCIDNMIHSRSGIQLRLLCDKIMNKQGYEEPAGRAKITPAFNLPSKYILHTVGPIIYGHVTKKDRELLASCYRSCLALAVENGCKSIAFCCISTGEFHFPNDQAARIAVETVKSFLDEKMPPIRVIFDVFKDVDLKLYENLLMP